jgi:UDP-N-acetylmuramyl pentapeptide synthase
MIGHSIQELAEIVGGRLRLGDMPPLGGVWEPTGRVTVDAQSINDGDVLLATAVNLAANRCCIDEAFQRGALGVIAAGKIIEPWAGKFSIQVDDAQWALWQLARSSRQHFDRRVIAVAGHVGKSTTIAMIDAVLGVDRSGCAIDSGIRAGLETYPTSSGDAKGELDTAAHLACPHIVVATTIESSLLGDDCGDAIPQRQYLDELLSAVPDDGCAIVSGDARSPAKDCQVSPIRYGRGGNCEVQATHVLAGDGTLAFVVDGQLARLNVYGRHHLPGALAAWSVARACGVYDADIAARLGKFRPLAHRCQAFHVGGATIIDNAAGRTPIAARASLAVLPTATASGKRIAVCGELAVNFANEKAYRRLGRDCVTVGGADAVVAIGSGASAIAAGAYENGMPNSSCVVLESPVNALCELRTLIAPGDAVIATGVEPSLADALVASFPDNSQRAAA